MDSDRRTIVAYDDIRAKIEEAERHEGPLTNVRELLRDLRTIWGVAINRGETLTDRNRQIRELQAELGQSRHEVAELQKESDAQQGVFKELRQLVRELRGEIDAQQGTIQGCQNQLNDRDAKLERNRAELNEARADNRALGGQLNSSRTDVERLEASYKRLRADKTNQRNELSAQIDALHARLREVGA